MHRPDLQLLIDLTRREFKVRYLGSILGSYWNVIHPLVMILIYTLVFSQVMGARLGMEAGPFSYSIYLCSGLLAWNFFSEVMNRGVTAIVDNASFLKKVPFPPYVLFGASLLTALINFSISFTIFLLIAFFVFPISLPHLLVYLVVVLTFALFGSGLALGLGCLNVFTRDFQQLVSLTFQLWFWFTPIIYLVDALPEIARKLLWFNPAFAFIEPLHQLFYFQRYPAPIFWCLMFGWIVLAYGFGCVVYRRLISHVRDQL